MFLFNPGSQFLSYICPNALHANLKAHTTTLSPLSFANPVYVCSLFMLFLFKTGQDAEIITPGHYI